MLFFIKLSSRRVDVAGFTARPDSVWVTQQARNLSMRFEDRGKPVRFLVHDSDAKYGGGFDAVFRADGVDVIRHPDQGTARQRLRRAVGEERSRPNALIGYSSSDSATPASNPSGLRRAL